MNITLTKRVAANVRKVAAGKETPEEKALIYSKAYAHAIAQQSPRAVFEAMEKGTLKITEVADRGRTKAPSKKVAKKPALAAPKAKLFTNKNDLTLVHPMIVQMQREMAEAHCLETVIISAQGIQVSVSTPEA